MAYVVIARPKHSSSPPCTVSNKTKPVNRLFLHYPTSQNSCPTHILSFERLQQPLRRNGAIFWWKPFFGNAMSASKNKTADLPRAICFFPTHSPDQQRFRYPSPPMYPHTSPIASLAGAHLNSCFCGNRGVSGWRWRSQGWGIFLCSNGDHIDEL